MFRLMYVIVANLWALISLPLWGFHYRFAAARRGILRFRIASTVPEIARPFLFGFGNRGLTLEILRETIDRAGRDPRVTGLCVSLEHFAGGAAQALSLRRALARARQRGLGLTVHLPFGGGTWEYFIATVADRVVLGTGSQLGPVGLASQSFFLKNALAPLGIEPEVMAIGKYKSAGDMFTRESMSDAEREQRTEYLDVIWETVREGIGEGRGVSTEVVERWLNQGLFTAKEALELRLVDHVAHEDELLELLGGTSGPSKFVQLELYRRRRRTRFVALRRPATVAVIPVFGTISQGSSAAFSVADEASVVAALECAEEAPECRGAVVLINSRGGGALTSERIHRKLALLSKKKPVVACFSDAAASGGYMIGVAAHCIVAEPTTLTGSIGVVFARLSVSEIAKRLGVGVESLQRGDHALVNSVFHSLSEAERELLKRELQATYEGFVRIVAEGRRRPVSEVEPLAGGRVYSGLAAQRLGLVDKLGGFELAVSEVSRLVGRSLVPELIAQRAWPNPLARLLGERFGWVPGQSGLLDIAFLFSGLGRERVLALCPTVISP